MKLKTKKFLLEVLDVGENYSENDEPRYVSDFSQGEATHAILVHDIDELLEKIHTLIPLLLKEHTGKLVSDYFEHELELVFKNDSIQKEDDINDFNIDGEIYTFNLNKTDLFGQIIIF